MEFTTIVDMSIVRQEVEDEIVDENLVLAIMDQTKKGNTMEKNKEIENGLSKKQAQQKYQLEAYSKVNNWLERLYKEDEMEMEINVEVKIEMKERMEEFEMDLEDVVIPGDACTWSPNSIDADMAPVNLFGDPEDSEVFKKFSPLVFDFKHQFSTSPGEGVYLEDTLSSIHPDRNYLMYIKSFWMDGIYRAQIYHKEDKEFYIVIDDVHDNTYDCEY